MILTPRPKFDHLPPNDTSSLKIRSVTLDLFSAKITTNIQWIFKYTKIHFYLHTIYSLIVSFLTDIKIPSMPIKKEEEMIWFKIRV